MSEEKKLMSLEERIAERVGKELVDLLPQEEWQAIIDAKVKHFKDYNLPNIIQLELEKMIKEKVHDHIQASLTKVWDEELSIWTDEYVTNLVAKGAKEIFAEMMKPMTTDIIEALRSRLVY